MHPLRMARWKFLFLYPSFPSLASCPSLSSLSLSLSLTLSLYSSIPVSLSRSLRGASQFRDTKRPGSIESSSSSLEFFIEWADSWRTPEGIEEALSLSLPLSPLPPLSFDQEERNRLERGVGWRERNRKEGTRSRPATPPP